MQENGIKTRRKVLVELNFQVAPGTKEDIVQARNMGKASASIPMVSCIKVSFKKVKCKAMEYTHTKVRSTLVTGIATRCTAKAI